LSAQKQKWSIKKRKIKLVLIEPFDHCKCKLLQNSDLIPND